MLRHAFVFLAMLHLSACLSFSATVKKNAAPIARIAEPPTIAPGATVVLDASQSSDSDGDKLSFRWEQVTGTGDIVGLSAEDQAIVTFTAPARGQILIFRLIVSDGAVESTPAVLSMRINSRPVADAGADLTINNADTIVINGVGSDPDGDEIAAFHWAVTSAPPAGVACVATPSPCLSGADRASVTFAPMVRGDYILSLVVNDGELDSAPTEVAVRGPNYPPQAVAAEVLSVRTGDSVVLDGSASSDPDGDSIDCRWSQLPGNGDPIGLQPAGNASVSFTAPDLGQTAFFQLICNDGALDSAAAIVRVRINTPPVASAGAPVRVLQGASSIVLEGTGVDADSDSIVGYAWQVSSAPPGGIACVATPSPCLSGANSAIVTFAPPVKGEYVVSLVVSDGDASSAPAEVIVRGPNYAPTAVAPAVLHVRTGAVVVLNGSTSSDPDGDTISYAWQQIDGFGSPVALQNATAATASFTAPSIGQQLLFSLTTSDGALSSAPAIVSVLVNTPPVADAGPALVVDPMQSVLIVGVASDADGDSIVSHTWTVTSAPAAAAACLAVPSPCLSGAAGAAVTFTPPSKGDYAVQLVVSDGEADSLPSQKLVKADNRKPIAVPLPSLSGITSTQTVNLDGTNSYDDDGDTLATYKWKVESKPSNGVVSFAPPLANVASPVATFVGRGTYFLSLTVTDDSGLASTAESVRIDVGNSLPVAHAGADASILNHNEVTLFGTASDADNDNLTYNWVLDSAPTGGMVPLVGAGTATVKLTPTKKTAVADPALCQVGDCYRLSLIVYDGDAFSLADQAWVISANNPPVAHAGADQSLLNQSTVTLDGSGSTDADGDPLLSYRWYQVAGPIDVTSGVGYLSGAQAGFTASANGNYAFNLVVADGTDDSAPDPVIVEITNNPSAVPTLSISGGGTFTAVEGQAFTGFNVVASDPQSSVVVIKWQRESGSASGFPALVTYPYGLPDTNPTIVAPAFLAAHDEGHNHAVYKVVAVDEGGTGLASDPVYITLYTTPSDDNFILMTPGGVDNAACGTRAAPCKTLFQSTTNADGNNDDQGNGKHILLTTQSYAENFVEYIAGAAFVPTGTRVIGGLDPVTFAQTPTSRSTVVMNRIGCNNPQSGSSALNFATGGALAKLENVDFTIRIATNCAVTTLLGVGCSGCNAEIVRSSFAVGELGGAYTPYDMHRAFYVRGGSASLVLRDVTVQVSQARESNLAFDVDGGGTLWLSNVHASATVANQLASASTNAVFDIKGGSTLHLRRSIVELNGDDTNAVNLLTRRVSSGLLASSGGLLDVSSSVVRSTAGPKAYAVLGLGASGSMTLVNATVTGGPYSTDTNAAVRSQAPVYVMNSQLAGFTRAVILDGAAALDSLLYSNALASQVGLLATCNGVDTGALVDLNAAPGNGPCNGSDLAWSGNLSTLCALVNVNGGDYHLNVGVANACLGGGAVSTPVSDVSSPYPAPQSGPVLDLDGAPRINGGSVEIGADEI